MGARRRRVLAAVTAFGSLMTIAATAGDAHFQPLAVQVIPDHGRVGATPDAALAMWQDFPVQSNPRPSVVRKPYIFTLHPGRSVQESGYARGMWTLPASIDEASTGKFADNVLSARAAAERFQQFLAAETPRRGDRLAVQAEPITVTSVKLIERGFSTDRGPALLPAWEFRFGTAHTSPTIVAAVPSTQWYQPSPGLQPDGSVLLAEDGRTLTYTFTGGPSGMSPCGSEFTPLVKESDTAVAFGAIEYGPRLYGDYFCTLEGHPRQVTVTLARPLGNRVLITYEKGVPLTVYTAEKDVALRQAAQTFMQCAREHRAFEKCGRRQPLFAAVTMADLQWALSS